MTHVLPQTALICLAVAGIVPGEVFDANCVDFGRETAAPGVNRLSSGSRAQQSGTGSQPAAQKQRLSVVRPTLHAKSEDGPAIPEGYQYTSGELLFLSFRIGGFQAQKGRVDLRWQLIATDPEGLLLFAPLTGAIREEVTDYDKDWLPKVAQMLAMPAQLPPGAYKIKVQIADEFAGSSADGELTFRVGGRPMPKVDGLTVLNLGFYRDEAERQPMEAPVYHAGDVLWAKFQVAGFQLGEKNRFDVEYGLTILSAAGKALYSQPKAAEDTGAPFYPHRLLNGVLNLNVTPAVQPAEYILAVRVKDNISGKEAEGSARFRVEKRED